jgi:hypothetical protein
VQLSLMCGNFLSTGANSGFNCFRHHREGYYVGNGYLAQTADLNYLGTNYGIFNLSSAAQTDTDNALTSVTNRVSNIDAVDTLNEPDESQFAAYFPNATNTPGTAIPVATPNSGDVYPIAAGSTVLVGEGPTQETAVIAAYGTPNPSTSLLPMIFASPLANSHKGGVTATLTEPLAGVAKPAGDAPPIPPVPSPLSTFPPYPTPTPIPPDTLQQSSNQGTYSGAVLTVDWATQPVLGDWMMCALLWPSGTAGTVTENSGTWTQTETQAVDTAAIFVFQKIAGAGESIHPQFTQSYSDPTNHLDPMCVEYTGVPGTLAGAMPVQGIMATSATATTAATPSLTPTVLNMLPLLFHFVGGATGPQTDTGISPGSWFPPILTASSQPSVYRYLFGGPLTTDTVTAINPTITLSAANTHAGVTWMGLLAPNNVAPSIYVSNATGIAANDYLTLGCYGVNFGKYTNSEVVQVASSYAGGTTIPLVAGPVYQHTVGEQVTEGCIRRSPTTIYGNMLDETLELVRLKNDFSSPHPAIPIANVASANQFAMDSYSGPYGGTMLTYSSFDDTQQHDYCSSDCAGPWGDGATSFSNVHQFCFLQNCAGASWQADLSMAWTEGGNVKPVWCTECNWPIIPVGASPTSAPSYFNSGAIPEDVGAVWSAREPLWQINHGYSRVYTFQLTNGAGGFCTYGLVYTSDSCGGSSGYGSVAQTQPKASYYALTDLIGLMTDTQCRYPGCVLTGNTITWGWDALPTTSHGSNFRGTDPRQLVAYPYEFANGNVAIPYTYESSDYLQLQTSSACYSSTSCYQWCGNASNSASNPNQYTCFSTNLYIQGAHTWGTCTNYDTDGNPNDAGGTFGHIIPTTSGLSFNGSDRIALTIRPELQVLYCTGTHLSPSTSGTPLPSPTPLVSPPATPDPTPTWAAPTPIPTGFAGKGTYGPVIVLPTPIIIAGPTATPAIESISQVGNSGPWNVTATPSAIVSPSITGSVLTVTPVAPGTATLNVSDLYGNSTNVTVTVNPTPGPMLASPNPVVFSGVSAPSQTITITDPYNTSAITASPTPVGQISAGPVTTSNPGLASAGATVVVAPQATGTPSLILSDGTNSVTVPVTIATSTPGPILASPNPVTVAGISNATPTPVPVALTETNYSGSFTTTDSDPGVAQTTVNGTNLTITPQAGGTETVTIHNQSTQTQTISVTVQTPSPVYTNMQPTTPYPFPTSIATPPVYTMLAQIKCPTSSGGEAILSLGTSEYVAVEAGLCNSTPTVTATNPPGSSGAHVYQQNTNATSAPINSLVTSPQEYVIAATENGANLIYWYCTYPTISCSSAPATASAPAAYDSSAFLIGAAPGNARVFTGDIWNVAIVPSAMLFSETGKMQQYVAAYATGDPYPSPTPTMTTTPPGPTPTPVLLASIAQPYSSNATAGPYATALPSPGSFTFITQIKCTNTSTNGNAIANIGTGAVAVEAGECTATPAPNPTGANGAHVFIGTGQQASPTNGLANGTTYVVGATDDGATFLTYYYCVYPVVSCTSAQTGITAPLTDYVAGSSFIGAANSTGARLFGGDIWNTRWYQGAYNAANFQTLAQSYAIPDPYSSPSAPPSGNPQLVYSGYFTSNTPFHHSVAALEANKTASVVAGPGSAMVTNVWNEGLEGYQPAAQSGGSGPIYVYPVVPTTTATYSFICTYLDYGPCNWNGNPINFPTTNTALAQNWNGGTTDHHIQSFDIHNSQEIDGEGFGPHNLAPGGCNISGSQMQCGFGARYPFSGSGLAHDQDNNSSGNAAGYAWGMVEVSQYDVASLQVGTPIYHALSIETTCEAPAGTATGGVYPARTGYASDVPCANNNYTQYGYMLHLISSFNIPNTASIICKGVLQALKTFGAYTVDNNGCCGMHVTFEPPYAQTNEGIPDSQNIWYTKYYPQIVTAGEGTGTNENFSFQSCMNYTTASDWEIIVLSGNSSNLPPYYGYGNSKN